MVYVRIFPANQREEECAAFTALLSEDEKARAARYRFEADRVRSIVTRATARRYLAELAQTGPRDIVFEHTDQGKPFVGAPQAAAGLFFNVSHSGDFGAVAITRIGPVGIDVEQVKDRGALDLAGRFFSGPENQWLDALPQEDRLRAFFRLWTIKEAVLKAHGGGLSVPLKEVCIDLTGPAPGITFGALPISPWSVAELEPPAGYAAAVALEGPQLSICNLSGELPGHI